MSNLKNINLNNTSFNIDGREVISSDLPGSGKQLISTNEPFYPTTTSMYEFIVDKDAFIMFQVSRGDEFGWSIFLDVKLKNNSYSTVWQCWAPFNYATTATTIPVRGGTTMRFYSNSTDETWRIDFLRLVYLK